MLGCIYTKLKYKLIAMNKNILNDILNKLKKLGCDQSDVFFSKTTSISSSSRLGKTEKTEKSSVSEIGIRAILDKRQSIISTTNLEKNNIDDLIEKVVQMAKVVPKNEYCGLARPDVLKEFNSIDFDALKLNDPFEPSLALIKEKVIALEESALSNNKIINSEGAEIAYSNSSYLLMGSNGLDIEMNKTHSDYIVAVLAGNKNSMEREYDYKSKVFFDELGDFEKIGKQVSLNAIKKLNSKKLKTCKSDVIFDSKVSSSLLRNLFGATNSQSIIKKTSFLKDKIMKDVFRNDVNIIDDPLMKKKLRSRISDCEGIESKKKHLINKGKLQFFFNSLSSSRELNHKPSGHASRSVSSIPGISFSNLFMENGKTNKTDMIKSVKKGLLVKELMGSSINYSTGDYSRGASGFWIENGEVLFPVSEITIAGNLNEIFSSLIPADDLEFNFGVNAPSCLVENLTLGGK